MAFSHCEPGGGIGVLTAPPGLAEEHLRKGYALRAITSGRSMWPVIRSGSEVEIVPCDGDDVVLGDVVLVRSVNGLVLHRVVSLLPSRLILRGDALTRRDQPVSRASVLGRMAPRRWDRILGCYGQWTAPFFNIGIRIHRWFFDR